MDRENRTHLAQGCLIGAFIGDAAGARLEFLGRRPSTQELAEALAMKGGGALGVAPGQITDDGELTLAMAHVLMDSSQFPREKVAVNYRKWLGSKPFDVGRTTYAALSGVASFDDSVAEAVARRAAILNTQSKSNGALMRSSESPRFFRRLKSLRGLSHEEVKQVFTRGSGTGSAHGAGAPKRLPLAVGGH